MTLANAGIGGGAVVSAASFQILAGKIESWNSLLPVAAAAAA